MPGFLLLPALAVGAGIVQYRKYKWETKGPLYESGWGLRLGTDVTKVPCPGSSKAPLLANDSSGPALSIKILRVIPPTCRPLENSCSSAFTDPFLVLKLGNNFKVAPSLYDNPDSFTVDVRLPTIDSGGQEVPRVLELYLYGHKASKVRLMAIAQFSMDRIMSSSQIEWSRVSVQMFHRRGKKATSVTLALRNDGGLGSGLGSVPPSAACGGNQKTLDVQSEKKKTEMPEAANDYVVVCAGGRLAIGVLEENKMEVEKES